MNPAHSHLSEKIHRVYTPLKQAREELLKRWNNPELRTKVEQMFGDALPKGFMDTPRLVMSRSVFTPNKELAYFFDLARELEFEPLLLEYPDTFVSKNATKYHLAKMFFCNKDRCSKSLHTSEKVIDFNKYEGNQMTDIQTLWGQGLVDFHHEFLFQKYPELKDPNKMYNFLEWFNTHRTRSTYYFYYLSLFVCHGILFDNFLWEDEKEGDFLRNKFDPSLHEVEKVFGLKPLIFPLLPIEHQAGDHWLYYNEDQKAFVESKL